MGNTNSWNQYAQQFAFAYHQEIARPLPLPLQNIAQAAKKIPNISGRINFITSQLAANFTYMGDWRTAGGGHLPRPMSEFVKNGLGDCKDFTVATIAMLKFLGITAWPAWIQRGHKYDPPPLDYPYSGDFNHAVVLVIDGKERIWVDPTNSISFAPLIPPDIAGRKALVLEKDKSYLRYTPPLDPQVTRMVVEKKYQFLGPDQAMIKSTLQLQGQMAMNYTAAQLHLSNEDIEFLLIDTISTQAKRASNWSCQPFQLTQRQLRNLDFHCQHTEEFFLEKVQDQNIFYPTFPYFIGAVMRNVDQRVADLYLGDLRTEIYRTILQQQKFATATPPQNCSLTTRWMDASRQYIQQQDHIFIEDRFLLRNSYLRQADFSLSEFTALRATLARCFYNVGLPLTTLMPTKGKL